MKVRLHPHATQRLLERGATEAEVVATVEQGESFPAKLGRTGYRRNFPVTGQWRGRTDQSKQLEVIAIPENDWLVITVIVRYF